jgi:general secretion pathway protein G
MKNRAFTLIELIVVIAIIAILAAIITPNAFMAIEKSKIARAAGDMKAIKTAAMGYNADTGLWPLLGISGDVRCSGRGFLTDDDGRGNRVAGWDGPYLEKWPNNPWGRNDSFGNKYYWDADYLGDDNRDGIFNEAQVIMFNVPRKSAQTLDLKYDDGKLVGTDFLGYVYQNRTVSGSATANPTAVNWMIMQPTR